MDPDRRHQPDDSPAVEELLRRALEGDSGAREELFARHRERLRRTIALRIDPRLARRVDVSDVVQDTYLEAMRRLPEYGANSALPFFLWLRLLAHDRLVTIHRQHVLAEKRTLDREVPLLPADSSAALVRSLAGPGPSPSQVVAEAELADRLRLALEALDEDERCLIVWRHFEKLTHKEAAILLGTSEDTAGKRYLRALERLRGILNRLGVSGSR